MNELDNLDKKIGDILKSVEDKWGATTAVSDVIIRNQTVLIKSLITERVWEARLKVMEHIKAEFHRYLKATEKLTPLSYTSGYDQAYHNGFYYGKLDAMNELCKILFLRYINDLEIEVPQQKEERVNGN